MTSLDNVAGPTISGQYAEDQHGVRYITALPRHDSDEVWVVPIYLERSDDERTNLEGPDSKHLGSPSPSASSTALESWSRSNSPVESHDVGDRKLFTELLSAHLERESVFHHLNGEIENLRNELESEVALRKEYEAEVQCRQQAEVLDTATRVGQKKTALIDHYQRNQPRDDQDEMAPSCFGSTLEMCLLFYAMSMVLMLTFCWMTFIIPLMALAYWT